MKQELKIVRQKVNVDFIEIDPLHTKHNSERDSNQMEHSISKTGKKAIYRPIVTPNLKKTGYYTLLVGKIRFDSEVSTGSQEAEFEVIQNPMTEEEKEEFIIEMNKNKIPTAFETLSHFRFYKKIYGNKTRKGEKKIPAIAKEMDWTENQVKEFDNLDNFYSGDGDIVLLSVLNKKISINQAAQLKKVIQSNPEKFNEESSYERMCDGKFDFGKLPNVIDDLSIDDDIEYSFMSSYLSGEIDEIELEKRMVQLGKTRKTIQEFQDSKNSNYVPILTDEYITENCYVIKGDNRVVPSWFKPVRKARLISGSSPYGDLRQNTLTGEDETFHGMSGKEVGIALADLYYSYWDILTDDGTIVNIMDDFRYNGSLACSLEFFVTAMLERGFHLVSRYKWVKRNAFPRNYGYKGTVPSFEVAYKFAKDPKNYYSNPNLFIEMDGLFKVLSGCTNHSKNGTTTRGGKYIQAGIKKPRNTFDLDVCDDVITSCVANPDDFYIQLNERRHDSQFPPELSAFFTLEGSEPGDLCGDIWNGVGNSMWGTLLTGRQYFGVEIENDYFNQTCRKIQDAEKMLKNIDLTHLLTNHNLAA